MSSGRWVLGKSTELPVLPSPIGAASQTERSVWRLIARNDHASVVRLFTAPHINQPASMKSGSGFPSTWILRSPASGSPGRWEQFPLGGEQSLMRIIGPWLLIVAGEEKRGRLTSPGAENQRPAPNTRDSEKEKRPPTAARFRWLGHEYYPGVLIAHDTRNGKTWQVVTNQGDSEPLLVDGITLYFRVNDRILRAELSANGAVGTPVLLAQHDDLRDAHWAFLGPAQ